MQRAAKAILLIAGQCLMAIVGTGQADGDIGDLGLPPAEPEIRQALTDLYRSGHPPDATIDVAFVGPILVGQPKVHPNPPPQPWCVRCIHPDAGSSPMYPVLALVRVTITQGLDASALGQATGIDTTTTTTYNGTPCAEVPKSQYCPSYYLYRDGQGNWQVA